jgi:hypothetical protein
MSHNNELNLTEKYNYNYEQNALRDGNRVYCEATTKPLADMTALIYRSRISQGLSDL